MKITNWNGNPVVRNAKLTHYEPSAEVTDPCCIRGNGRSYGDASLNATMLSMLQLKSILRIEQSVLEVSAGYTLGEVLSYCIPKGFNIPVIPGTQHVTIGGMIAADVHGKNHERNGTIGHWVEEIQLQLADGSQRTCSPTENAPLFRATIGGIGLTGIILTAKIRLEALVNSNFRQTTREFSSFEELLHATDQSTAKYKVGWFDFNRMANFFLLESEEIDQPESMQSFRLRRAKLTIPFKSFPFVNGPMMNLYNKHYAAGLSKRRGQQIQSLDETFFPLDRIRNWNNLYGTRGFYQFQFSFPMEGLEARLKKVNAIIRQSGHLPLLSVVKKHGAIVSPGILSYPEEGISIAYDFANKEGIQEVLRALYRMVAAENGRIYLIKDALIDVESFESIYTNLDEFKAVVDEVNPGTFNSLMAKRLNLVQ